MNNQKIELTYEERSTLVCYILSTTQHRKQEREAWEKLAGEKTEDGSPRFKNAASNVEYYKELEERLEAIKEKLDA